MSTWTTKAPRTSDPGSACGTTAGYAELPRCGCGHLAEVHAIPDGTHQRKACSASTPGKCPCRRYEPRED